MGRGAWSIWRRRAALALLLAPAASAQGPRLELVYPRCLQRGQEVELQLRGRDLPEPRQLLSETLNLEVLEVTTSNKRRADLRVRVPMDAGLGLHGLRLVGDTGISGVRLVAVTDLSVVEEVEPNGDAATAQGITLGTVVTGVAGDENIDLFAVELEAGDELCVELLGMRLGDTLFDPALTLLDPRGFTVASSDDAALSRQDPTLQVRIAEAGRYLLQVGEASYKGNDSSRYVLSVRRGFRPTLTLPLGGAPGAPVELAGRSALGEGQPLTLPLEPARPTQGLCPPGVAAVVPPGSLSPIWLRVNDLPNHLEGEGEPIPVPAALNGVLAEPGEVDRWEVRLTQGQQIRVSTWARRLRSPLDPVTFVRGEGGSVDNDDDAGSPDSGLEFGAQRDGTYVVEVRDHLGRGGPDFAYRVEIAPPRPVVRLATAGDVREVAVPRGGLASVPLRVERGGLGADLEVLLEGLPEGVTAEVLPTAAPTEVVPVLLRAAPEAAAAATGARVRALRPSQGGAQVAELHQRTELVEGQNNTLYWGWDEDRLPVSVMAAPPFRVRLEAPAVQLPRAGQFQLPVTVERDEGFEGAITVTLVVLPPGIDANRQRAFAPADTRAEVTVQARGDAALGRWPLVAVAEAEVDGTRVRIAAEAAWLEVVEPFATFTAKEASVEQGQQSVLVVQAAVRDLPAPASVRLVGLPHKVESDELRLEAGTTELLFPLRAAEDSPPGKHGAPGLQAIFTLEGGTVVQGAGTAQVRVQRPAPPIAATPAPAPKAEPEPKPQPKPEPAKERPLSRLERLRKEAQDRGTGASEGGQR